MIFWPWSAQIKNNRNKSTKSHNVELLNSRGSELNDVKQVWWYEPLQTVVCNFATSIFIPPLNHRSQLAGIGKILLPRIPKTPYCLCYISCRNNHSGNIVGQVQEFWVADTWKWQLMNDLSSVIMLWLYEWFFWNQKKWMMHEGRWCGNDG